MALLANIYREILTLLIATLLLGTVLSFLHCIIDIALDVGVHALIIILIAIVVLVIAIALASSEKLSQLLWGQSEREVLRHSLESSETTLAPLRVVAHLDVALVSHLIGVSGGS